MCSSFHHNKHDADIKTPPSSIAQSFAVFFPAAFDAILNILRCSIELIEARAELEEQSNRVFHVRQRDRLGADPAFPLIMVVVQRYGEAAGAVPGELKRGRFAG